MVVVVVAALPGPGCNEKSRLSVVVVIVAGLPGPGFVDVVLRDHNRSVAAVIVGEQCQDVPRAELNACLIQKWLRKLL